MKLKDGELRGWDFPAATRIQRDGLVSRVHTWVELTRVQMPSLFAVLTRPRQVRPV